MDSAAEMASIRPQQRPRDRLVAGFLLLLMALGSLALWIGVPAGCMWAASKLTDDFAGHFVIALPMTLAGMVLWALGLFWINGLYLRVTGFWEEPGDDDEPPRRLRGPLEPLLAGSLAIAFIALVIWFFAYAENPSIQVI